MKRNLSQLFIFGISFFLLNCSSTPLPHREQPKLKYATILHSNVHLLWSPHISHKVKLAVQDYENQVKLENNKIYGDSVRYLDLRKHCAAQIKKEMKAKGCPVKNDVLKDARTKKPLLTSDGKTIPLVIYLCPDGGFVRVKPDGDPTSRFRPQPHASKGLRFPYNSKFENFDDEIVKINNSGKALPKWGQDINTELFTPVERESLLTDWSNDVHFDLVPCSK